jgi:uncharacterized protein (DUF608 family)
MPKKSADRWPVLKVYDADHLERIALPLGGIGTGTVSLGGRGDLRDWEVANRPAKGFTPPGCFFALWARPAGKAPAVTRCLEGPIPPELYEGAFGCKVPNHGLPRFRRCSFAAAYPLGQVFLSDPDVPLDVRIEAFNPLVPADAEASGIPLAVMRFVLANRKAGPVDASVCGSVLNFIGADGSNTPIGFAGTPNIRGVIKGNRNERVRARGVSGVRMCTESLTATDERFGTMAIATTAGAGVTARTAWAKKTWGGALLDFWEDFSSDGRLEERALDGQDAPTASLAVRLVVPPGAERSVTFLLTWHFPNRMSWTPKPAEPAPAGACCAAKPDDADRVGNYYATRYADAWDVARRTAPRLAELERRSVLFVRGFCDSDLPDVVKDAALSSLTALRTQTSFRTADGNFFGFEGCGDTAGCCVGSCTHVWNYEWATAMLFGELARNMREIELLHMMRDDGLMHFRVQLPLGREPRRRVAAADGQMGCLMKLYREWKLSGDDGFLRRLWPRARKAIEFCWIPGGWDADRDGVMEGCQHNTMDVEYYGANPQMGAWYLGALRACEEMAWRLGEKDFADTCRELFQSGSRWMDENLFNGEYYEQQIRPAKSEADVAEGLRIGMGAKDLSRPNLQLGSGCLVDQLVGQYMAHLAGLGYLLKPANVRKTLAAILRHNLKRGFLGHFNHNRSYALGDEQALLMATYPRGRKPAQPFPYDTEVMTGFEYAAAVGMIQEGMVRQGLDCIAAVRARYDGRKRSPFDEAECGHHYARAMASWSAVLALTGFDYSAVDASMAFSATGAASTFFWSTGWAWGTIRQRPAPGGKVHAKLAVLGGRLRLRRLTLAGAGQAELPRTRTIHAGASVDFIVPKMA